MLSVQLDSPVDENTPINLIKDQALEQGRKLAQIRLDKLSASDSNYRTMRIVPPGTAKLIYMPVTDLSILTPRTPEPWPARDRNTVFDPPPAPVPPPPLAKLVWVVTFTTQAPPPSTSTATKPAAAGHKGRLTEYLDPDTGAEWGRDISM